MKKDSNEIYRFKMRKLDNLKISLEKISKRCDDLLVKIDRDGTAGYYSTNEDLLRYATDAWRASLALGELKLFEEPCIKKKT